MTSPVMNKKDIESTYYWYKDGENVAPCKTDQFMGLYAWNPLEDWNDTMMLVEKLGPEFNMFAQKNANGFVVQTIFVEKDPQKAICMAALSTLPTEG